MMKIKRIPKKLLVVIGLMVLVPAIFFLKGCGNNIGHQNWTITSLHASLSAPTVGVNACAQQLKFRLTDPSGNAANGIDIVFDSGPSGTQIAKDVPGDSCANAQAGISSVTLSTDNDGIVSLEFYITAPAAGQIFFIDASSGGATPAQLLTAATTT